MSAKSQTKAPAKSSAPSGWTLPKILPWLMLICGLIGVAAALMLSIERFNTLKNPHYVPVCNLNPIFSCSSVSSSQQAQAVGFYNPFLGLAGFGGVSALGLALLAGAKFKRWLWRIIEAGVLLAVGFITWLQFQTLYRIGALCLFCMITWAVTIPLFWYVTLYNIRSGNLWSVPALRRPAAFLQRHHGDILVLWLLIIIALILKRFWYYWSTL